MFHLIFCGVCAPKLWHVRIFSGNSPTIKGVFVSEVKWRPKKKVFTKNGAVFSAQETQKRSVQPELERFLRLKNFCLSFYCNFMINNNMSVRSKFMRVRSLLGIGGHGTLQKYRGTGTRYFAKISTAVPVLSN